MTELGLSWPELNWKHIKNRYKKRGPGGRIRDELACSFPTDIEGSFQHTQFVQSKGIINRDESEAIHKLKGKLVLPGTSKLLL